MNFRIPSVKNLEQIETDIKNKDAKTLEISNSRHTFEMWAEKLNLLRIKDFKCIKNKLYLKNGVHFYLSPALFVVLIY